MIPHGGTGPAASSSAETSKPTTMTTRSMADGGQRGNIVDGAAGVASGAAVSLASVGTTASGGDSRKPGLTSKRPQRTQQQQQQKKKFN